MLKQLLDLHGEVGAAEWAHIAKVADEAPNAQALIGLQRALRGRDPGALLAAFVASGPRKKAAGAREFLSRTRLAKALRLAGKDEVPAGFLPAEMARFSYFDFCQLVAGRRPQAVELFLYDISNGWARFLSPAVKAVVGKKVEGVWHSSVGVLGYELWYGGGVYASRPGETPFGQPQRTIRLGYTYATAHDIASTALGKWRNEFTPETYDILDRNCNHFSGRVTQFLCGASLPRYVSDLPAVGRGLLQTDVVAALLGKEKVRGILNSQLGSFGATAGAEAEVYSFQKGDLVIAEDIGGSAHPNLPLVSEVEALEPGSGNRIRVRFLDVRAGKVVERTRTVPARSLTPLGVAQPWIYESQFSCMRSVAPVVPFEYVEVDVVDFSPAAQAIQWYEGNFESIHEV